MGSVMPVQRTHAQLQRKCACGGASTAAGQCEACRTKRLGMQTKLAISTPGDVYEQEADRVADAVMRMPGNASAISPAAPAIQRRATNDNAANDAPMSVAQTLSAPAQALDHNTRSFFESRFGHDFSRVRIHADARAAESANAVSALAYTVGEDIAFASNQYNPASATGRRLLAHELTHVVQQARDGGAPTIARKQTPWPAWHQTVLNAMAAIAGASDGKDAEAKWPRFAAYLCGISKEWAGSLHQRLGPSSEGLVGGTDDFATYLRSKFPTHHTRMQEMLDEIARDILPAECKTKIIKKEKDKEPTPVAPTPAEPTPAEDTNCASEGMSTDAQKALCAGEVVVYRKVLSQLQLEYREAKRDASQVDPSLKKLVDKLETWVQDHKMRSAFATWEDSATPQKRCQAALFAARALRDRLKAGVPDATDANGQAWLDAINTLRNAQGDLAKLICFIKYADKPISLPDNPGSVLSRCDYVVYQSDDPTLSAVWKNFAILQQPKNPPIPFGATTEEGFNNVIARAKQDDCSCISSIEFWGHGSPGGAFSNRMTGSGLKIPGADANGPDVDADQRSAWLSSLTGEQQAYIKLRDILCRPGGSLYYRTCSTFAEQRGASFAEKATRFWQVPVSAHTEDIGILQPGKRTLRPCEHAYWSLVEKSCDTCGGDKK